MKSEWKSGGYGKEMLALRGSGEVRKKSGLLGRPWRGGLAQDGTVGPMKELPRDA